MTEKIKIEKNTVSETLVLPLNARAHCSKKYPNTFPDKEAERLISLLNYDFNSLNYKEFVMITWAVRNRILIDYAKAYLTKHPKATIINLGCGADTSFSAIDNGQCHFINLDLPEVIAAREKIIQCVDREKNIAADAFDLSWLSHIETPLENGVYIISGGVFMFFDEEKLRPFFKALSEKLPGGAVCFDAENSSAVKKSNKIVEKAGNKNAKIKFAVDSVDETFKDWSGNFERINVVNKLPDDISDAKELPFSAKQMLKFGCNHGMIKFIEIIFK